MKKFFLSVAVMATLALASCGSSAEKAEDKGAALKTQIENCTDPDSLKMLVQQAQEYAEQLVKEGKDEAAADYLNEVAPVLEAKKAQGLSVIDYLKNEADSAVMQAQAAADSVKAGAENAVNAAADVAGEAKDKAVEAVGNAADAAKAKAEETAKSAADAAKAAASDAAKSAAAEAAKAFKK